MAVIKAAMTDDISPKGMYYTVEEANVVKQQVVISNPRETLFQGFF
jgi:hypothetical protein